MIHRDPADQRTLAELERRCVPTAWSQRRRRCRSTPPSSCRGPAGLPPGPARRRPPIPGRRSGPRAGRCTRRATAPVAGRARCRAAAIAGRGRGVSMRPGSSTAPSGSSTSTRGSPGPASSIAAMMPSAPTLTTTSVRTCSRSRSGVCMMVPRTRNGSAMAPTVAPRAAAHRRACGHRGLPALRPSGRPRHRRTGTASGSSVHSR